MTVKVRVRNFQSIQDAEIVVDGLTAITGPNNTGKSAMLRAIRGAFQNTRGTSFVRHGEDKCSVVLEFDDGRILKWEKGPKTKPTYVVDGGNEIHPGQGVPDEVRDFGVCPVMAGGREVWPQIAPQLDGQVFLLNEPGSVLAEAVANVERVGRLNRSLKASEKDRRSAAAALKVRLDDRITQRAEVEAFEGLDVVVSEVEALEAKAHQAGRVYRAVKNLRALRDRVGRANETVSALEGVEGVEVPEVGVTSGALATLEGTEALRNRYVSARDRAVRYEGIEDVEVDISEETARKLDRALEAARTLQNRLSDANLDVMDLEGTLESKSRELELVEKTVIEVLGDLGECPTCGSMTEHDH